MYGDITDNEVIDRLNLKESKMFVCTANKYEDNLVILKKVKEANSYIPCIVTAQKIEEALDLYKKGADYVILPHFLGGDMVSNILGDFEQDQLKMMMFKYRHVNDLMKRQEVGHEHPFRSHN